MTNSRIASAFLAPALAAILAVACSSSDNNGGGTTVGGNGGASTNAKGGSGPSPVTGNAACNDAVARAKECGNEVSASDEAEFLTACKDLPSTCTKCLIDSECADAPACLTGEACAPTSTGKGGSGGTGGSSSGKGGTGGTSSGKGGTGGTGGSGSGTGDPCTDTCAEENQEGVPVYNDAFKDADACVCETDCAADCSDSPICQTGEAKATQECITCVQGTCLGPAQAKCEANASCKALLACLQQCQ